MRNILYKIPGSGTIRKYYKRYSWLAALTIFGLTTIFWIANLQPEKQASKKVYIKTDFAYLKATTTTTTAVPQVERRVQTEPQIVTTTIPAKPSPPKLQGDWIPQCKTWMAQAGIPIEVHDVAIELIDRESKCNPNAQNPRSTAYGIGQFLNSSWKGVGCVKTSEPVEQLRCMNLYVGRHGGWAGALAFRINNGWY